LQVVEGRYATEVSSSTTVFADTNLTATITPSAATSKILVIVKQSSNKSAGNADTALVLELLRGATKIDDAVSYYSNSSLIMYGQTSLLKLDSPNTTSATTYKTQFANQTNAASVQVQAGSRPSTIILMEIGA
jgi:hypothetical protein